jgi:hypothetical protein
MSLWPLCNDEVTNYHGTVYLDAPHASMTLKQPDCRIIKDHEEKELRNLMAPHVTTLSWTASHPPLL